MSKKNSKKAEQTPNVEPALAPVIQTAAELPAPVATAPVKRVSIQSVAEKMLLAKDESGNGFPYAIILASVKEQFPSAKTTINCITWYAAHMRKQGITLPPRPRLVTNAKVATPAQPEVKAE